MEFDQSDVDGKHPTGDKDHSDWHSDFLTQESFPDKPNNVNMAYYKPQITDLPEEILERILSFLSPYHDHDTSKLVCHQWHRLIISLIKQARRRFYHKVGLGKIGWTEIIQAQGKKPPASPRAGFRVLSISERFSHSCAYLNGSMYVFGGCTNTNTTFNDLWRLDLTTRRWMRPVAMGSYPSPKSCASMVNYKGQLVLYGGWSQPVPYPLHQSANYFSELHTYDPATNRWTLCLSIGPEPDALGGHSASIIQDRMVVFGGSPRPGQGTNKIWVYNFHKSVWYSPKVKAGVIPEPRYGQYQCTLDGSHILIMGGCGGPGKIYSDFYILTTESDDCWYWTKLQVNHPEFATRLTWCHAVCKVENKIVVLCKSLKSQREGLNIKPNICYVDVPQSKNASPTAAASLPPPAPAATQETLEKIVSEEFKLDAPVDNQAAEGSESLPISSSSSNNRNLLALQQTLHRQYVNLTDQDNHQHNSHLENSIPEGQILRLQNRSNQNEGSNHHHHHHHPPQQQQQQQQPHHDHHHHQQQQQHYHRGAEHHQCLQELNQPHAGQLRRFGQQAAVREGPPMPSIRPNANSNRQKQLEALQRQEELLKSKSKALAEARKKSASESESSSKATFYDLEEEVPSTVIVKNRMDVHVVDISSALTTGEVEWKPESPLLPPGAPVETMCCSLVEGRAELVLFGGLPGETGIPMLHNSALNKLYILHT